MTPSKGKDFEVMVVGGGPAGLSAALVLGRCRRKVLVCDDGRYRNDGSQALHCFLGQDGIVPGELLERSRAQLQRYDTLTFSDATVAGITPQGGGFIATFQDKSVSSARAVLIATGMVDERPPLKGLDPLFGRSVHVCPYCDGWEHRDAPVAVYGRGEKGAAYATLLRQWTHDLVLCTDGQPLGESIKARLNAHGISIREEPIEALEAKDGCLSAVRFRAGDALPRRALFFTTGQHPRSPLLDVIGCTLDHKGGVACDADGRTNVPGAFVAGDVSRDVQLAIIAAAEGARAALAINKYLGEADIDGTEAPAVPFSGHVTTS